jgi:putative ABC transport system permease protein
MLDSLRSDVVFGWRQLRKNRITSAAAILSLALAIGACTSAFRLVDALLLRPLPVVNPARLRVVAFHGGAGPDGKAMEYDSCSYPMFLRMEEAVKGQADLVAVSYADRVDLTYGADQEMERAHLQFVSGRMFPLFGIRAAQGRVFTGRDDVNPGAHPFAVLSFDYWKRRFGGDPKIVGRTFRMNDRVFEIVGVSDERFTGTETGTVTDIFVPLMMKNPQTLMSANNFWMRTFIALRPGVQTAPVEDRLVATFRAIQVERAKGFVNMPASRLAQHFQEQLVVRDGASGRSNMQREYRPALLTLSILVALVLLIACANVANLMTARAASRAREMALRVSIGAGRSRLVQLVLMESAWIAVLATALGGFLAWRAAPYVLGMLNPPDDPSTLPLPGDWRVLSFGLVLAAGVTFLFGLVPALRASGVKPAIALKGGEDPHSRRRLMHSLIALQVAFCFLVVFVAGLFVSTLNRLSNEATGFSSERVLNLETISRHPQEPYRWNQVVDGLRAIPGVERVSLTGWPMMSGQANTGSVAFVGGPPADVLSDFLSVSAGWAETMKIPLISGRDFRADETNPGVAIVNQAFAKQFLEGRDPTGQWFERMDGTRRTRIQIIGYARDARSRDSMRRAIRPTAWIPFFSTNADGTARPVTRGTLVVKTAGADPLAMAAVVRQGVVRGNSDFYVENIRTQDEINRSQMIRERLLATLALFFACVALVLAGVGLYGVLDYSVLQRRREIGIRIAIGARSGEIARRVTSDVFVMVLAGAAGGVALGMMLTRYIGTLFFEVKASDPSALALPSAAIVAAGVLSAMPAVLRAIRTDLIKALRAE